jgi:hypothetical protein
MREHQRHRQHEYPEPGAEQFAHISLLLSLFGKAILRRHSLIGFHNDDVAQ